MPTRNRNAERTKLVKAYLPSSLMERLLEEQYQRLRGEEEIYKYGRIMAAALDEWLANPSEPTADDLKILNSDEGKAPIAFAVPYSKHTQLLEASTKRGSMDMSVQSMSDIAVLAALTWLDKHGRTAWDEQTQKWVFDTSKTDTLTVAKLPTTHLQRALSAKDVPAGFYPR